MSMLGTHAIRIHGHGGPEVLRWEEVEVADPGPGQVRLRHTAVGLNYIDVYFRTGLYSCPLPTALGMEASGVVEAVGANVTDLREGDRVAYASGPLGAYAEVRIMPADRLVKLPDTIEDRVAASIMMQGMTAQYLLFRTYKVKAGDTILVHAAAGGVGLLLCQWARHLGATVIGTVGSPEKAKLAEANGCTHAILYRQEDFAARVAEITGGAKLPVVYDSIGADTFLKSLDCLAPLGLMVSYGNASGPVPPIDLGLLSAKGSLFITRPSIMTYTAKREDLLATAASLFEVVSSGKLQVQIHHTYPLSEAAEAHRDLEARRTTGSTLLLV